MRVNAFLMLLMVTGTQSALSQSAEGQTVGRCEPIVLTPVASSIASPYAQASAARRVARSYPVIQAGGTRLVQVPRYQVLRPPVIPVREPADVAPTLPPAPTAPALPSLAPGAYYRVPVRPLIGSPSVTLLRPVVVLRPMPAGYIVGQGILGQPKVYLPGQPLRNFLRYITP